MRNEQETKRQAEARRKVRRSQSNTRTQSVRRTSLRDKGLTARRDAVEEARFRLQAGVANVSIITLLFFVVCRTNYSLQSKPNSPLNEV